MAGIVNGTTNYILSAMDSTGAEYAQALADASSLGYAEADPTADVEGYDAAAKAAILASIAFHTRVTADDVYREGITNVTPADFDLGARTGLHHQAAVDLRAADQRRWAATGFGACLSRAGALRPSAGHRSTVPSTRSWSKRRPPAG